MYNRTREHTNQYQTFALDDQGLVIYRLVTHGTSVLSSSSRFSMGPRVLLSSLRIRSGIDRQPKPSLSSSKRKTPRPCDFPTSFRAQTAEFACWRSNTGSHKQHAKAIRASQSFERVQRPWVLQSGSFTSEASNKRDPGGPPHGRLACIIE